VRRADRLFEIIQVLRRAGGPLTADAIALELETSRRTIYRDIAALTAQRVPIRGEAGIGFVLERGFDLPPLMLKADEVDAVTLGMQWVIAHADADLARAALDVLAKIAAVMPDDMRVLIEDPAVGTPAWPQDHVASSLDFERLREWSRRGRKIDLCYEDATGAATRRVIWPFLVGYVATVRVIVAWCEMRGDFRTFRADRISRLEFIDEAYPERSAALRRRWLAARERERSDDSRERRYTR